jgi:ADP-dependent NAD(P)H-hydrate dehydratase / NAD(P)H-hydrate epimerase
VIPVVTPEEMAAVDRAAPELEAVLIERAGYAVAVAARRMLGRTYGSRVTVVAGRGNNGADGRAAARHLGHWGAWVQVVDASSLPPGGRIPGREPVDLVIDAAYGTGLSRPYQPPDPGDAAVLAVDIPSGLSGTTGVGEAMRADRTVTFAAFKPGLLLGDGPDLSGRVVLADIGLGDLARDAARMWVVTDDDLASVLPARPRRAHKWQSAVEVVAGSASMVGAPLMASKAAMRAGAGYVLLGIPGIGASELPPGEHVQLELPDTGWAYKAAEAAQRARAIVVGPGLGRTAGAGTGGSVARFLAATSAPAVVDADAITSLGDVAAVRSVLDGRAGPLVLTPHEGEYRRLTGHAPSADRITDVADVARQTGAVVLLKGSPTVVADPGGTVMLVTSGSPRLATAGTGDVLSGMIAAFMARGLPAFEAAAFGAHCHGRAASLGPAEGLVASDLPDAASAWLSGLRT